MMRRRAGFLYSRYMARIRGPVGILLQGGLFAFIGLLIFLVNLASSAGPIQKVTGNIQDAYVQTLDGAYHENWLVLSNSTGIFIFDRNSFHPVWDDSNVFRGQKIDVYYED